MKTAQSIPVFLASDDNYAPFVATTIYSILENTNHNIDFYILDGGITNTSKQLIETSLSVFPHKNIKYFDMQKYGLERFPNIKHYSLNAFSRYFIPEIAKDLQKVIYLDVDIIVKGDIADLYQQDLEGYPLAAVLEDFYAGNYQTLKEKIYPAYQGDDKYFNTGVMVMDLEKFRDGNISQQAIEKTIELYDKLNCPDQDILNIIFENNFKILDYKYNFMPDHLELLQTKHPEIKSVEPVIIHYTGQKPWKSYGRCAVDFTRVLQKTMFRETVAKRFAQGQNSKDKMIYLFNLLPLYKIKRKNNVTRHYLCGFIPLLKIKKLT